MKISRGFRHAMNSFMSAAGIIYFQLFAMVILQPNQFGLFSATYLVFAFGTTLLYCIVIDVWVREEPPNKPSRIPSWDSRR